MPKPRVPGQTYHPDKDEWGMMVRNYLRAGFGVEDISLKMEEEEVSPRSTEMIRHYISKLRKAGMLQGLYRRKRE